MKECIFQFKSVVDKAGTVVDKLLMLRQVTWKSTHENPTQVWSQRGPKGPLIDQGHGPL